MHDTLYLERRRAAAHAHVAGADAHAAEVPAADPRAHARATSIAATSSTRRTRRCSRRSKDWPSTKASASSTSRRRSNHFAERFFGAHEDALPPVASSRSRSRRPRWTSQCGICGGSGCAACKGTGWIEILGSGMVHPIVLEAAGVDSERTPAGRSAWGRRASPCSATAFPISGCCTIPTCASCEQVARMNVSYEWLRAFVPFDAVADAAARSASRRTSRRSTSSSRCAPISRRSSSRASSRKRAHPDSDHLHVTKVDAGTGELLDVVCGAPNVTAGKLYPFAPTGTVLPAASRSRSERFAAQISERHALLGARARARRGARRHPGARRSTSRRARRSSTRCRSATRSSSSTSLPNRPDLLSHLGVAREIAAVDRRSRSALPTIAEHSPSSIPHASVKATTGKRRRRHACGSRTPTARVAFMGVVIRGVKVGPSPEWLVERLESVGSRSINNVVDATQLRAARARAADARVRPREARAARAIVVRRARAGEERSRRSTASSARSRDDMIVIADAEARAGDRRRHGRQRQRSHRRDDGHLPRSRELRSARAFAQRGARSACRPTRAIASSAASTSTHRAACARARRAAHRARSPAERVDGAPVDLVSAPEAPLPIALRRPRVARLLGEAVDVGGDRAQPAAVVGFDGSHAEAKDVLRVIAADLASRRRRARSISSRRSRACAATTPSPTSCGRSAPSTVPDAPLVGRHRSASRGARRRRAARGASDAVRRGGDGSYRARHESAGGGRGVSARELLDTLARRAEYNLARMQGNVRLFEIGRVLREPAIRPKRAAARGDARRRRS